MKTTWKWRIDNSKHKLVKASSVDRDDRPIEASSWREWFDWQIEGACAAANANHCRNRGRSPQTTDDELPDVGTDHLKLIEEQDEE